MSGNAAAVVGAGGDGAPGGAVHDGAGGAPAGNAAAAVVLHGDGAVKPAVPYRRPQGGIHVGQQLQVLGVKGGLRVVADLGAHGTHDTACVGVALHGAGRGAACDYTGALGGVLGQVGGGEFGLLAHLINGLAHLVQGPAHPPGGGVEGLVVLTGGLGHAVHPVLDHIQLIADVVRRILGLGAQGVGVVLQQTPNGVGLGGNGVQVLLGVLGQRAAFLHQASGGAVDGVGSLVGVSPDGIHLVGGALADGLPAVDQITRQGGQPVQGLPNGGQVARRVQGGEGDGKGPLQIQLKQTVGHLLQVGFHIVQLIGHGLQVGADGFYLALYLVDGVFQGGGRLGEGGVGAVQQIIHAAPQGVNLPQQGVQLGPGGVGEGVHVFAQAVQRVPQGRDLLVQGVGHGPVVVQALLTGVIYPVPQSAHCILDGLNVLDAPACHGAELVAKGIHLVKEGIQAVVEAFGGGGAVAHLHAGLKLAHNASHVLPAQNGAGVGALGDVAGLESGDAAGVVAQVLIAHSAGVGAGGDGAPGQPGDAAGVGGGLLVGVGVDGAGVGTASQGAKALADDAAGVAGGGHRGLIDAALHGAGLCVEAHHAAHVLLTGDRALGGAAPDGAAVFPGDEPHLPGGAAGGEGAIHN